MNTQILIYILAMAIATFLTRRLMLVIPERYLTQRIKRGLLYVSIGVFAGLIFPSLFFDNGKFTWKIDYLITAIFCIILMKLTKSFLTSFLGGLLFIVFFELLI